MEGRAHTRLLCLSRAEQFLTVREWASQCPMGLTFSQNDRVRSSRNEQDAGLSLLYPRFEDNKAITFCLHAGKGASCAVGQVVTVNNQHSRRSAGHSALVLGPPVEGVADSDDDLPLSQLKIEPVVKVAWLYAVSEMDHDVQAKLKPTAASHQLSERYRFLCIDMPQNIPISSIDDVVTAQPYLLFNQNHHQLCIAGFYAACGTPHVVQFTSITAKAVKSWFAHQQMLFTYPVLDSMQKMAQGTMHTAVKQHIMDKHFNHPSINLKHFPVGLSGWQLQCLDKDLLLACQRDADELVVQIKSEAQFKACFGVPYISIEPERSVQCYNSCFFAVIFSDFHACMQGFAVSSGATSRAQVLLGHLRSHSHLRISVGHAWTQRRGRGEAQPSLPVRSVRLGQAQLPQAGAPAQCTRNVSAWPPWRCHQVQPALR